MTRRYTFDDWRAAKSSLAEGKSIREVATLTGISHQTIWRWSKLVQPPDQVWCNMEIEIDFTQAVPPRPSPKARLSYEDRVYIAVLYADGKNFTDIATTIGVHRTTISREIKNRSEKGFSYNPKKAHLQSHKLKSRPKMRRLDSNNRLRHYVINALMLKWSPEQISRRIKTDYPNDEEMRISHETIYQALYVQGYGTLRQELGLELALRSKRKARRSHSKLPSKTRPWLEGANISLRPAEADDRAIPGHWEGDLIIGSDMSSCLITLVERNTRFLLMSRLCVHDADTVAQRLVSMVAAIPKELSKTLTWDQGSEMAHVADFELASGFKVYFCDPHSPWQRPTNENTNGLVREFFPKGTDFTKVSDQEVEQAQWLLNNRPRKVLNAKFPSEALMELLADSAMTA